MLGPAWIQGNIGSARPFNFEELHNGSIHLSDLSDNSSAVSILSAPDFGLRESLNSEITQQSGSEPDYTQTILDYAAYMKREGLAQGTVYQKCSVLRLIAKNTDLLDGEAVKQWIADSKAKGVTKKNSYVNTYHTFGKWKGFDWKKPKVQDAEPGLPFIPMESELDQLISGSGKQLATILQTAKESGARSGEIARLEWKDLDTMAGTLAFRAEKGSNHRLVHVSPKLVSMLNLMSKESARIFPRTSTHVITCQFSTTRKRLAKKLGNPRLLRVHPHTFRHWAITMEYAKTKDLMHCKEKFGHKSVLSTIRYVQLIKQQWESDDQYYSTIVRTAKEAEFLSSQGWEHAVTMPDGTVMRKKKKWFELSKTEQP
jgi:integrase